MKASAKGQHTVSAGDKIKFNYDSFRTMTIEECEKHFYDHYENEIEHVEDKDKFSFLRSCIELLDRLEGTTHHLFAGRVLIFLTKVIPLFDRSGVNLKSEFDVRQLPNTVVQNLKLIGDQNIARDKQISQLVELDIEEGETLSDEEISNEAKPQEDADRSYERFWKVQQLLGQPSNLYDKNVWFTFRTNVDMLIAKIENKLPEVKVWDLRTSYMTDSKSLTLQLNDVNMCRCFLVQILIVLQYLELPAEKRMDSLALDRVQASWSSSVAKRIYGLIDVIPNPEEGRKFLGFIRHVLRREEIWNKWKCDKCPELKKLDEEDIVNMRGTYHKRRKISDELSSARSYGMHVIGSPDMSRLWNMKSGQKFNTPELSKYLNISQEKQDEIFKDPNHSFRLLRLLRRSPHFYSPSTQVVQSLDLYLKEAAERYSPTSSKKSSPGSSQTKNSNNGPKESSNSAQD